VTEKTAQGAAPSRREFFLLGSAAVSLATAGFVVSTFRYLVPTVLYEPPSRFTVGNPIDFPAGSVTFLEDRRLFLFNGPDGFFSVSSVCTHLGCNVKRASPGFECPCHGSRFDENGRVVQGPAPAGLAWYALSLSSRGELIVDLDRTVSPDFRLKA
jgi:nitrite reductase/ring-hydroxylating ferredoxin subunit